MDDDAIKPVLERERARIEGIPVAPSLPAFLEARFRDHAEETALCFFEDGDRMTYGELAARSHALAQSLHRLGVGHGSHVAVMTGNRIEFPVTWCALALLGAVIVPVNARYTPRELAYVCTDSNAERLVIDDALVPALAEWEDRPVAFEDEAVVHIAERLDDGRRAPVRGGIDWDRLVADGDAHWQPDWPVDGADLMNIQYTSGTTGFPKGVMLTQRYWLILSHVAYHMFRHKPKRVLVAQPYFYMDPQWLTLTAFYDGGTAYAVRRASASRFVGWCRDHGVDRCLMPEVVTKQPARADDRDNAIDTVWTFNWRGPNRAATEARFGITARECFGMTEIGLALYTPSEATHRAGSQSCGVPLAFREATIRDDAGRPVPPGQVGELWVRGDSVARAYWNKPEANAETFADGWFRTGDLFVQDAAGWFTIIGRKKDMIRRSSENIAAREVEAVITELDLVQEAAVLPVPDDLRGEEIKAYVIPVDGAGPSEIPPETILAHCRARLAPFKVPRFIAYADELPRTPGRKVAKHEIIRATPDLRAGAFDRETGAWLPDAASGAV